MSARANRANDLFGLSGRKNKLDVRWRFFDNLEKRVEALGGDHMRFIQDENFVAITNRCKNRTLTQLAGIINAVVAGGVNLDNVKRTRTITRKLNA